MILNRLYGVRQFHSSSLAFLHSYCLETVLTPTYLPNANTTTPKLSLQLVKYHLIIHLYYAYPPAYDTQPFVGYLYTSHSSSLGYLHSLGRHQNFPQ